MHVSATLPKRALTNQALHWHELLVYEAEQESAAASKTVDSLNN